MTTHPTTRDTMADVQNATVPNSPPSRHQLALMIWLCVFPTLTVLNVVLGDRLDSEPAVVRTFVLATIAVPIVIYGLMPHLHRARARLLSGRPGAILRP